MLLGSGILAALLGAGEGTEPSPNSPPTVEIVNKPPDGHTIPYRIDFFWSGTDPDSGDALHHYEYSVDPPSVFAPAEIAHPETSGSVTVTVRPGSGEGRDTVDVSKEVEGSLYSFSWIGTLDDTVAFAFETPVDGSGEQTGEHRLFLRGRDLGGTYSELDSARFTARNLPPQSELLYPDSMHEILDLGDSLHVVAMGVDDVEPIPPGGAPAGYRYKLLRLDTLEPPVPVLFAQPALLYSWGDSIWPFVGGDSLRLVLPLDVPGDYMIGVRAVDERGLEETTLAFGRNVVKFQTDPGAGRPHITLMESRLGVFAYAGTDTQDTETAAGVDLQFTWSATAELYGGTIQDYSWGYDLVDPQVEGPLSGWSDWGPATSTSTPIHLSGGASHMFFVRARDTVGKVTLAALRIQPVEMLFDRDVLIVDDSFDDTYPTDAQHDALWGELAAAYAESSNVPLDAFYEFAVHGADDRGSLVPIVPTLEELGRYKVVVWECRGSGYNAQTGLNEASAKSSLLAAYLSAGGKLWLGGRLTVGAMELAPNGLAGDLSYPKEDLGPGHFAYDFMKLRSARIINDKGASNQHLLNRAKQFPKAPVLDRWGVLVVDLPYDSLLVDFLKLNLAQRAYGGCSSADAISSPILAEADPGFEGNIDSLYVYGAAGPEYQGTSSVFQGKLCGLRWSDPDPDSDQGRIQWFGFPLYYMKTAQAQRVFRQSLDWFRGITHPVSVQLLAFEAARDAGGGVVVQWETAEAGWDLEFHLYREEPDAPRRRLTQAPLSGSTRYRFVDDVAPPGPATYWLEGLDRTGASSWFGPIPVASVAVATRPILHPVYPNPIVGEARLVYSVGKSGPVRVTVFDVSGRRVAVLVDATLGPGTYSAAWRSEVSGGSPAGSGLYWIRLQAQGVEHVRKVLVLR